MALPRWTRPGVVRLRPRCVVVAAANAAPGSSSNVAGPPVASLRLMSSSPFDRTDAFDELARRMDADMDAAFGRMDR